MESYLVDNFVVYFDDGTHCGKSRVYAIDCVRDRFLVAYFNGYPNSSSLFVPYGKFLWVDILDCKLINMEEI